MVLYEHYSQIHPSKWVWRSFSPKEISCKGDGSILLNNDAMESLQLLRDIIGRPIIINSAYRSPLHNARVGGSPMSRHKNGDAFDISLQGFSKEEIHKAALAAGFRGF